MKNFKRTKRLFTNDSQNMVVKNVFFFDKSSGCDKTNIKAKIFWHIYCMKSDQGSNGFDESEWNCVLIFLYLKLKILSPEGKLICTASIIGLLLRFT